MFESCVGVRHNVLTRPLWVTTASVIFCGSVLINIFSPTAMGTVAEKFWLHDKMFERVSNSDLCNPKNAESCLCVLKDSDLCGTRKSSLVGRLPS